MIKAETHRKAYLPTTASQLISLGHLLHIDTNHSLTKTLADLSKHLRVLVVSDSLDNSAGTLLSIARLENTRANKDTIAAQLHHQRSIGRGGNTTSGEVNDRQTAELSSLANKLVRSLDLTGERAQLRLGVLAGEEDTAGTADLRIDSAHVLNGLNDITGASLTLSADHSGALGDAAQGLTEVAATADEGDLVAVLGDVVDIVGGGEDLGFVDVVNANGFKDLYISVR